MDVLKILVSANYKYIPSLDDIQEMTAVTRLRNQLLEAEHYQLAVEVRFKVKIQSKMTVMSSFTHIHDFLASVEHKRCYADVHAALFIQ